MNYLVVYDSADRGVYAFKSKKIAEDTAKNLSKSVIMSDFEKDAALEMLGEKEIYDGLVLIRKYRDPLPSAKPKSESKTKAETKEETKKQSNDHIVRASTPGERFSIITRNLYTLGKECLKLTMCSGEQYILFNKSVFYTTEPNIHSKFLISTATGIEVNTIVVDDAIKNGKIRVLTRSKIDYVDDYAIISDCDDAYSPDTDNKGGYVHRFEKIVLDTGRVESIVPIPSPDLGSFMIKNEILTKYLVKHML